MYSRKKNGVETTRLGIWVLWLRCAFLLMDVRRGMGCVEEVVSHHS